MSSPASLRQTLRDVFGADEFRPGQEAIIRSVMAGRDTLAIMPTGAGKSLCYQLPALHLPGVTVVVSPLISLMKDQTDKLGQRGIEASQINSSLSQAESRAAAADIAAGTPEFILTTPEQLADGALRDMLRSKTIDLFVVDEAHCVSQWGHDFRPAYLLLRDAIRALGRPPVLALTATAPESVRADVLRQLDIPDAVVVDTGAYRANLDYEVVDVSDESDKDGRLIELVTASTGPGIVYASTIKGVETALTVLRAAGVAAARYHGQVGRRERARTQDRFMSGEIQVVVATNAFGMGIDKPDIRFVVHYSLPGSLEAYYQESGRAGRDGAKARCVLLYEPSDRRTQLFFIGGRYPEAAVVRTVYRALEHAGSGRPASIAAIRDRARGVSATKVRVVLAMLKEKGLAREQRRARFQTVRATVPDADLDAIAAEYERRHREDRAKLDRMIAYAQTALCRWKVLLEYFGEQTEWEQCGHCDNCGHPIDPPVQAATGDTHPAAADDTSQAPLRVGDRVRVPVHGMGEVQMVDGDKVELSFANGAVRRFKRRFVRPLQP